MSNGFLSQEEIDSLLNGEVNKEDNSGSVISEQVSDTNQNLLTDIEKDLIGEVGNISMGSASTALYQIINQKVDITTPNVSITTLNKVKEGFNFPNIILDVEYTSGIVGRNVLIMKISDAALIANLMMGGDGNVETTELSEIEISAVQEAMNQMIGSAATSMATMFSREVNISPPSSKIWKSNDEQISDVINPSEDIVKVSFNIKIGNLLDSDIMQILPLETAKKIVSIMMGEEDLKEQEIIEGPQEVVSEIKGKEIKEAQSERIEVKTTNPTEQVEVHRAAFSPLKKGPTGEAHKNIDLILDVPLNVSVVLGRTQKSIKEILSLSTGSLIELEKLAEEPVEVLINGKKIAYGEVVVVDENFGVRITDIVSSFDRIKSLN